MDSNCSIFYLALTSDYFKKFGKPNLLSAPDNYMPRTAIKR